MNQSFEPCESENRFQHVLKRRSLKNQLISDSAHYLAFSEALPRRQPVLNLRRNTLLPSHPFRIHLVKVKFNRLFGVVWYKPLVTKASHLGGPRFHLGGFRTGSTFGRSQVLSGRFPDWSSWFVYTRFLILPMRKR